MSPVFTFRSDLPTLKTVVIKVGSRIATASTNAAGLIHLRRFVGDISALRADGVNVVLVSSGAIAHGMQQMSISARPKSVPMLQACASIGQGQLMSSYGKLFARRGIRLGQVLLTWDDLRDKRRYLNLRNTLFQLLDWGVVPVINENDSVGIDEITFGDNDTLGAQIALLTAADLYVMLTDVCGLFRGNPKTDSAAEHIPVVHGLTPEIFAFAGGAGSAISVGGMATKLRAAQITTKAGVCAVIGDGDNHSLREVLAAQTCSTLFTPAGNRMTSKHRWIAFTRNANGAVIVDDGAKNALVRGGKSLLPAGIRQINGVFKRGDLVLIQSVDSHTIGKGLVNYSSTDLALLKGCRTDQIAARFGKKEFDEAIHRDNLVILAE